MKNGFFNNKAVAPLFYLGTLISSVGSFAFNVALIAFLLKNGFHLGQASFIIALQRFVPVVTTGFWGHWTDRLSSSATIAASETIAALCSVAILTTWNGSQTIYPLLTVLCVVRSIVVSIQVGSRCKMTKLFSDDSYACNSKNAIWLNKATQGATLFGGLLGWVFIRYFSLEAAIVFDGLSFLLSGMIAYLIPNLAVDDSSTSRSPLTWMQKFKDLFQFNSKSAILDILLFIPMMGTVAYMSRLAGNNQSWIGIYMAGYGLAVWVAGFLERGPTQKLPSWPFWGLLGASFIMVGAVPTGPGPLTLIILFIKDLSFWVIFHRISGHIQTDTPVTHIGSVMSARNCIMTAILTSGEVLVGAWANRVPLSIEGFGRGFFSLSVGLMLLAMTLKSEALEDRPAL